MPEAQPDRLATVAAQFGMQPAPVPRCRVLDLGCGEGANLVSMACQWPEGRFVGIDSSEASIALGMETVVGLGLDNVELHHMDIGDAASLGKFDYLVAHGVYSWAPPEARDTLLSAFKASMAPNGVAYVSFDAYPGAQLREIARDMLRFGSRDLTDLREQVVAGRAFLESVVDGLEAKDLYGWIVRNQLERIERLADAVVCHDDLGPWATPFMLHEVVAHAERHGLQYVSDAGPLASALINLPETTATWLRQIPIDRGEERDQYLDFVTGRGFRRALLCHNGVPLRRDVEAQFVTACHVAAKFLREAPATDAPPGSATFRTPRGSTISTQHRPSQTALDRLAAQWPQAVAFSELLGAVPRGSKDAAEVAVLLFRFYSAGELDLHLYPPRLTIEIGERPRASPLARRQIERGPIVFNLRHTRVVIEDEITRRFLPLVDGTRSLDQLVADLNRSLAAESGAIVVTHEQVQQNLKALAKLALLAA